MLDFITWDISPQLFEWGPIEVRWYGLLFATSFVAGYLIMQMIFKKEGISIEVLDKLATYMVVATVVGARLGHCLFYQPDYYLSNPIEILKIWEGGLASHGAAVAIILGLWLFARYQKKPYLWVLDRIVIVVALAGVFIRTGNLMNSEIYGNVTDMPWGFIFVQAGEYTPKHPTQIYEALSYLLIFAYLLYYYFKTDGKPAAGRIFGIFLVTLFGMRFLIEFVKEDQVAFEAAMSLNMGQLLSIPFVLSGIFLIIRSLKK
ncbi:MAG: prolipoprotein diacylglyceryl transferase [Bacteroidales bacterium]|nr:prolipoprotein diacylglyceryl transferase [Bacteroidales bacterium]